TLLLHKHMLGAAETNALCPKGYSSFGVTRIVRVCPDTELAELISPAQQELQVGLFIEIGINRFNNTREDFASGAVNRDIIAFFDYHIGAQYAEILLDFLYSNTFAACHTGQAQATGYHSGVTGRSAASRQNALGNKHTMNIVGAGLRTYQHHGDASFSLC